MGSAISIQLNGLKYFVMAREVIITRHNSQYPIWKTKPRSKGNINGF